MSFNLRNLKVQKSDQSNHVKKFYDHLIVGNDAFAVLKFLQIKKQNPDQTVVLVSERMLKAEDVADQWKYHLHFLRNEFSVNQLKEIYPYLNIEPSLQKTYFYKDSKFHEFGGRAKSMELQPNEDFFIPSFFKFDFNQLVPTEDWNGMNECLLTSNQAKICEKIELTEPTDLVEKTHFKLSFADNTEFHCEKLYWGDSPKKFLTKTINSGKLPDSLAGFASNAKEYAGIVVSFEMDKPIYSEACTMFLPQSVTHEEGHYVGELQGTLATFVILIQEETDTSEEELAKKIRHMKRVIERVLPDFTKVRYTERIRFEQNFLVKNTSNTTPQYSLPFQFIGKANFQPGLGMMESALVSLIK